MNNNIIQFPVQSEEAHTVFNSSALPEADMLRSMGFESAEEMQSAMKEYEAYCESLDHSREAVPSLMEFLGRPHQGSDFFAQIQRETAGQVFSSKEELEAAVSHVVERERTKGLDDFLGLSPQQMQRILSNRSLPENELFALNPQLPSDAVERTLAVKYAVALLTLIHEEGGTLPLTPKGNLKRVHTTAVMASLLDFDSDKYYIRSEDDVPQITHTRYLLYLAGYIDLLKTRVRLTVKGANWLGTQDFACLYRELLSACADDYEWLNEAPFPDDFDIIQDSLPFSLLMLKESRHKPRTVAEYLKGFTRAFPAVSGNDSSGYRLILFETAYHILFFSGFCRFFGLVQGESRSPVENDFGSSYTTTELFDRLFIWKT